MVLKHVGLLKLIAFDSYDLHLEFMYMTVSQGRESHMDYCVEYLKHGEYGFALLDFICSV